MAIYSEFFPWNMVIFHSYVSLPEGKSTYVNILGKWSNDALQLTRTPAHCPSHWLPNHCSSATPITAGVRSLDSTGGDNMWQPMITGVIDRNRKFISSLFFNVFHLRKGFRFSKDLQIQQLQALYYVAHDPTWSTPQRCRTSLPRNLLWSLPETGQGARGHCPKESVAGADGSSSSSIWQLKRIQKPQTYSKTIKHP